MHIVILKYFWLTFNSEIVNNPTCSQSLAFSSISFRGFETIGYWRWLRKFVLGARGLEAKH